MAEVHQKYDFIDPYDPMWDRSPFKAKSDLPKHQYFAEYANQLRDTEGANLKLRQILSSNCVLLESVLYFLTFQCSDNCFYEAKIYLHDSGYELVKFRSAKFWPRKDKNTNEEGGAELEGSQIIGKNRKK
ncbi:hypothetical protein Q3G72_011223 [Acer saccharum]|nr:hypothetical protein Q3G72_011223 [Acer saccharum]